MAKSKDDPPVKMKRKEYEKELRKLQVELVALQEWVKKTGTKVCIVFEGRDTAGKGGAIKAITQRVSPRVYRVVALPSPTDREKTQMYLQRYVPHFPAGGEIVMFDRSWYNRAGVEPVMGFCTPAETEYFLDSVGIFEQAMVHAGIVLIKYWIEVSEEEQSKRLQARVDEPGKIWKLSGWTSSPTAGGGTTPRPATGCSRRATPSGRLGTWCTTTTSVAAGSTSSRTS